MKFGHLYLDQPDPWGQQTNHGEKNTVLTGMILQVLFLLGVDQLVEWKSTKGMMVFEHTQLWSCKNAEEHPKLVGVYYRLQIKHVVVPVCFSTGALKKPPKPPKSWDLWAKTPENWWKTFSLPILCKLNETPASKRLSPVLPSNFPWNSKSKNWNGHAWTRQGNPNISQRLWNVGDLKLPSIRSPCHDRGPTKGRISFSGGNSNKHQTKILFPSFF